MAGATLSNMDAILQNDYQKKVESALSEKATIFNKFKKKVLSWTGRQAVFAVKVGRGNGGAYTDGTVPAADHAVYKNLNVTAKILQARGQIASELMVATDSASAKAFVSAVTEENKNAEETLVQQANDKFWSGGLVIGFLNESKVGGAGADWEFSGDVEKLASIVAAGATTVDLIRMDDYAVLSNETVNSVDVTNSTINLTACDTTAVGAGFGVAVKIKTAGAGIVTGLGLEPIGVYGQMAEPTHFSVDRTDVGADAIALQGIVRTALRTGAQGRTAITPQLIQKALNEVDDATGQKPDWMCGHSSALEKYAAGFQTNIRVDGASGAQTFNAGYQGLTYGDMPFESDRDCGRGLIFLCTSDSFKLCERQPVKLWTHGGSAFRPVANSTDVEFIYEGFHQVVCTNPSANALVHGLTFA